MQVWPIIAGYNLQSKLNPNVLTSSVNKVKYEWLNLQYTIKSQKTWKTYKKQLDKEQITVYQAQKTSHSMAVLDAMPRANNTTSVISGRAVLSLVGKEKERRKIWIFCMASFHGSRLFLKTCTNNVMVVECSLIIVYDCTSRFVWLHSSTNKQNECHKLQTNCTLINERHSNLEINEVINQLTC